MPVAQHIWKTPNGRVNFAAPATLVVDPYQPPVADGMLRLFTLRSDIQFNTTIYNEDDRFRGFYGGRRVLSISPADIGRLGFVEGDLVDVRGHPQNGQQRRVHGLRLVAYNVPDGFIGGYYPERNRLLPLAHHARESMVPAANSIAATLTRP